MGRFYPIFEFLGKKYVIFKDLIHKYLRKYKLYTKKQLKNSIKPDPTNFSSKGTRNNDFLHLEFF